MKTGLASVRSVNTDALGRAVRTFEEEWRFNEPVLERHWGKSRAQGSISILAALVKSDLRFRFAQGERPAVSRYLERFPELREQGDRVLSLIYEEFCLLEEQGERPDVSQFCDRYPTWRDSLASQLQYHDLLSRMAAPSCPAPRFPEPGEYFQEFLILRELGRGSAGRVYLARDESLGGREVALKISPDRGHEPSTVGRLDHPHIVKVHSVVFQSESHLRGICMQYQSGLSLDEVMRRIDRSSKRLNAQTIKDILAVPESEAAASSDPFGDRSGWDGYPTRGTFPEGVAWIIASLARALAYAHSLKIWHRDVKPANILLARRDGPQLLDFNLAHDPNSLDHVDAAMRGGTLPYMAPEQVEAFRNPNAWDEVGPSADIYSLGLVLREFLTGQPPETPESSLPLHKAIVAQLDLLAAFRDSPRRLPPSIPRALEAITARCLAYSPADRYPDALALAEDLQRFIDRRPLLIASNPSRRECLFNWTGRHRYQIGVCVVLLSGLLITASYRPAVQMLIHLEQRNTFKLAVHEVDANSRHPKAIAALESLVDEYPNSPLGWLYLGIAQYQSDDFDNARESVTRALNDRNARTAFHNWTRENPRLLDHLETIGSYFVTRKTAELAKSTFEKALEIDPNRTRSRFGLAEATEYAGEFELAHDRYSELIKRIESRAVRYDSKALAISYKSRARNRTKIADSQNNPTNALRLYREALADLEQGRKVLPIDDPGLIFAFDSIKVKALIGLARVFGLFENPNEAVEHREHARKTCSELKPGNPEEQREWGFLKQLIEDVTTPGDENRSQMRNRTE